MNFAFKLNLCCSKGRSGFNDSTCASNHHMYKLHQSWAERSIYHYHIWIFAHVDGVASVKMFLPSCTVVEVVVHLAHLWSLDVHSQCVHMITVELSKVYVFTWSIIHTCSHKLGSSGKLKLHILIVFLSTWIPATLTRRRPMCINTIYWVSSNYFDCSESYTAWFLAAQAALHLTLPCHFRISTQRVTIETWDPSYIWSRACIDKKKQ